MEIQDSDRQFHDDGQISVEIPPKPLTDPDLIPKTKPQFDINLQALQQPSELQRTGASSSHKTPKTPISDHNDLFQTIQRIKTVRSLPKRSIGVNSIPTQNMDETNGAPNSLDPKQKKKTPSHQTKRVSTEITERVENILGQKCTSGNRYYTEDQVWEIIKKLNSDVYIIAQNDNMLLEDVLDFVELVEMLDVNPRVFQQMAQNYSDNTTNSAPEWWQRITPFRINPEENIDKKWRNIQEKNPGLYKQLHYYAIKDGINRTNNKENHTPAKDMHIDLQREEIKQLAISNSQQKLAVVVTIVLAIGGWVFGLVGQLLQPSNNT